MYKHETAYKLYLVNNGMGRHSACGYVANIKKYIDPAIKTYINTKACSLLDEEDTAIVASYIEAVKVDPILIELNKKSHRHMTAPLARYAQFLDEFKTSTASHPASPHTEDRNISDVENEIAVFRKYKHQVPAGLIEEYQNLSLRNALTRIESAITRELKDCESEVEFVVRYDKTNGVRLFQQLSTALEKEEEQKKKRTPKAARTNFIVMFPDGLVIKEKTAKECFVKTIIRIGIDRVKPLGLQFYTMPLLGSAKADNKVYASGQVEVRPGLILMTSGTTDRKIKLLNEIDSLLNIGLTIEVR